MDELPKGWKLVELEDIAFINPRHPRNLDDSTQVSFIPMIAIAEDKPDFKFTQIKTLSDVKKGYTHFADGDILFAKITPCMENGKAAIARNLVNQLGCGTTEVHVIRPLLKIPSEYIYRFIHRELFRKEAAENMTGTAGQLRVPTDYIKSTRIPLPPINEQRRIVAKLEKLLAKVNACGDRLDKIPTILKRFRQSVLAAACSGRLTADWREQNPDIEPAEELLKRIKKARLIATLKPREVSKIDNIYKDIKEDNNLEGQIPESWMYCQVDHIGNVCNGSTPSRKHIEYWNGEISWVSSGEVRNNVIQRTRETITTIGYSNSSVRLLPIGTVLIAMIGEGKTRGQTSILEIEATINQNIAAVIIEHGLISSKYLWYWFQCQYESNRNVGSGSGPQALNCQRVRELPFILPPLAEQEEIVRRVEALFQKCDQIEARYQKAKAYTDKLTQAILAKAFRGELVPQDPNDEPAEVLLERIKAEKAATAKPKKTTKKRGKKASSP